MSQNGKMSQADVIAAVSQRTKTVQLGEHELELHVPPLKTALEVRRRIASLDTSSSNEDELVMIAAKALSHCLPGVDEDVAGRILLVNHGSNVEVMDTLFDLCGMPGLLRNMDDAESEVDEVAEDMARQEEDAPFS